MMMLWTGIGVCLLALLAAQGWVVYRVRKQDRLVDELGKKTIPQAVQVLVEKRYAELIAQCLARQPEHEAEHIEAHGGTFTSALRVEAIARRLQRMIARDGLPALSVIELRQRAREALWPRK